MDGPRTRGSRDRAIPRFERVIVASRMPPPYRFWRSLEIDPNVPVFVFANARRP